MLHCQQNPVEAEEIFRFDEDEHFLQMPKMKSQKSKKSSTDFRSCSAAAAKDANGNQVKVSKFNCFASSFDGEEILSILPQKNFTFDIMAADSKPRRVINRTTRCFDLSSMYHSLSGSSEEEDEFEPYDYSSSFEDMTIEGLRIHLRSCFTCGVHWHEEQASLDCTECGGYALFRPCPDCDGRCHATWTRNLDQSHSLGKARWTGACQSLDSA